MLVGVFAALALSIAAVGIYGVISFAVSSRTREIGGRVALGARPGEILAMLLQQGMVWAVGGMAIGLVASFGLTGFLKGQLFEIVPTDPTTIGLVCLLLFIVALAACTVPALRGLRVEPATALRHDG